MYRLIFMMIAIVIGLPVALHAEPPGERTVENAVQDYQFQDFEVAKDKFKTLLAADPNNVTLHYYLGLTYQQISQLELAIEQLEIVAKSDQAPTDIQKDLAELYLKAGYPKKAHTYYRQQYLSHITDGKVAMKYASILTAMHESSHAIGIYQYLLHKTEFQNQSLYFLGEIYSNYGAYGKAIDHFSQVKPSSAYADGAKEYLKALEPVVKPISVYLSTELFYETNPDSASSSRLAGSTTNTVTQGSGGFTTIAKLDTAKWEANEHWRFGLSYLFYGVLYRQDFAKTNDFVGHFFNPVAHWQVNPTTSLTWQVDLQSFYFSHEKLSTNTGLTMQIQKNFEKGSLSLDLSGIKKSYTEHFGSAGNETSLAYLNALAASVSLKGSRMVGNHNLSGGYTLSREHTRNSQTSILSQKAADNQRIQHMIVFADQITFDNHWSLVFNGSYAYAPYRNIQSGQAYPSAIGKKIHVKTTVAGLKVSYVPTSLQFLTIELGAESTRNKSEATSLAYDNSHYALGFSGMF